MIKPISILVLALFVGSIASFCQVDHSFNLWNVAENIRQKVSLKSDNHILLVFLSPECPLCKNYTKQLNTIAEDYRDDLTVYGVFPGIAYTPQHVKQFGNEFQLSFDLLIDSSFSISKHFNAAVTPEAILINKNGEKIYTGAIDDWAVSLGKTRTNVTANYVAEALEQSLGNLPISIKTMPAVGCAINDY